MREKAYDCGFGLSAGVWELSIVFHLFFHRRLCAALGRLEGLSGFSQFLPALPLLLFTLFVQGEKVVSV